ncbi:hypothetical protein GCM10010174_13940 [Kutzneria viridogrisea]|uniref:histidine kinase n=2 Tax=Kutzneria TaxID=43356 RepID=W5WS33_9PSEU|nr:HAMP domain-containing sensor histidine kinase [Kutzneria albida]AHI00980.1 hypothetical protein KALB_7622 [Kutzneria albida DSM 43870]MBA8926257.1 two-component system OmpR family sensor kinase [Kutzneria viridogrisea]
MACPEVHAQIARRSRALSGSRIIVLVAVLVTVVLNLNPIRQIVPVFQVQSLLTLGAAAITAGAVLLAYLVARMDASRAINGIAAAIGIYGLLVMPATVVAFGTGPAAQFTQLVRLLGCAVFLVLMGFAAGPGQPRWTAGWRAALLGSLVTLSLAAVITSIPALDVLTSSLVPSVVVLVGWFLLAVHYLALGLSRRAPELYRIGIGVAVIAASQVIRISGGDLVLAGSTRVLGSLLMFMALSVKLRQVMQAAVERAAERDHEMQNVLAGLDGMTHVLPHTGQQERELLTEALREEITRLRGLLDRKVDLPSCAVEPVLSRLVAMRRSSGLDVSLDVQPDLRAAMPASALAQVVTNLLANCERHAPGASVRVNARAADGRVRIDVQDDGPGLPPELRRRALTRGVHDSSRGGSGLGLYVSSQLVADAGGSLELLPTEAGCHASVQVPA